jgi:hypothetical protein
MFTKQEKTKKHLSCPSHIENYKMLNIANVAFKFLLCEPINQKE